MTDAQALALAKMHAANAALTPEERKARSAKAAAASRTAVGPYPQGANRTKVAAARPPVELPLVAWRVTSTWKHGQTGVEALVHTDVSERTVRRALKLARKQARAQAPEGTTWGGLVALVRADSLDFAG